MDQRKGDPRVYIVTLLFLSCILSGGVLLGLYLLQSDPNPLFLQAGMFLVGVPWLFWFLGYVYSCILKPCTLSVTQKSVTHFDPEKGEEKKKIPENENVTPPSDPVAASSEMNSPREGEKHVQFGNVMVLGGDEEGRKEEEEEEGSSNGLIHKNHMRIEDEEEDANQENGRLNSRSDDEDCDRTPLRTSLGNK